MNISSTNIAPAKMLVTTCQIGSQSRVSTRSGFTLIELVLSLSLIVVTTAIIGSLMQMYASNFATRGEDIRRAQIARSILTMMAEDIRGVVLEQEYDTSVLEQLTGAGGSGGTGGESTDTGATSGTGTDSASSGLASTTDDASEDTTDLQSTLATTLKPGIYGSQFQLMVDVSRLPRAEEMVRMQQSLLSTELMDIPGDIKTVTYFVQAPTQLGVQDSLRVFGTSQQDETFNAGLVRRQLDRAVSAYAQEMGNTQQLLSTGDLLAPEVLAIEFAFFDGMQWLTQWDSSTQSLPWLVQISLAMQSATGERKGGKMNPGITLNTLSLADREAYGVEVYQLVVAIPGAQLRAADAASADQAAGMEAMGL